jgi:hypothetical protein
MSEKTFEEGLIASLDLKPVDVPDPQSELRILETFCLTIDGYRGGTYSGDMLLAEADKVERGGLENASLDELREAAFIRQRQYRWTTDQGQTNEPLARKIRGLVSEIRRRLSE